MNHVLLVFYIRTDIFHCSIFVSSYISYPKIYIYTQMRYIFWESLWFIYPLDRIKYIRAYFFYFIRNTYFTKWIFNSITNLISSVYTNDKWITTIFIRIQINKCWSHHVWLIIHGQTIYSQWSTLTKHSSTSIRTIKVCLMNLEIYAISCFPIKHLWISSKSVTLTPFHLPQYLFSFHRRKHPLKYFPNTTDMFVRDFADIFDRSLNFQGLCLSNKTWESSGLYFGI